LAAKLQVTWKKSAIGYKEDQKRTITALGLKRLGHTVELPDNRAVRGMITKVRHLVEVAENSED
jgi:large subunit ribosomal protein L30